jgi:transglutaminase-like putative cysteine protease
MRFGDTKSVNKIVCALILLAGLSLSARADDDRFGLEVTNGGGYHLETHFKQRVAATLTTSAISPETVDGTITVYAPMPPELPMQHLVSCNIRCRDNLGIAPTKVTDIKNPFQHYLRLNIPVTPTSPQHPRIVDMTYVVDLYSAKLAPGPSPKGSVSPILPASFSIFTQESSRDDFNSPAFQNFLNEKELKRKANESALVFAQRAYQILRDNLHYVGHPFSGKASTLCQTLTGDCGVYAIMSASTLAANEVPVATFPGRWAYDEKADYGQFHCFNGFFEPGVGWITFDALNKFGSVDGNFIAFSLTSDDCPEPGITRPLWQFQIGIYHGHSPYHPHFEDHWHVKVVSR